MNRERSAWGVILIVIGLIFLGERLGWGFAWNMGHMWPLILVALGAVQLIAGRLGGAFWLLFVGGLFMLHQNHILRLHDSWPLFIVAAGVGILLGRADHHRRHRAATSEKVETPAPGDVHE